MRLRVGGTSILLAVASGLATSARAQVPAPLSVTLVVCAPGYPGSTEEAQPAMDALAAALTAAAGWKPGDLEAVYFETERAGLERIGSRNTAFVLAPLPFWLQHRAALKLEPVMQAVQEGGQATESWSLVAPAGQVKSASDLAGFDVVSVAGYAPRFVRGPALGAWGELPRDTAVTFSNAVLTTLRRASGGARVAMLLDRAQAAALPTLPFATRLQVVATSAPLPVSVLASVAGRLPAARQHALVKALMGLGRTAAGAEALAGVRIAQFVPADQAALARARDAFDRVKE